MGFMKTGLAIVVIMALALVAITALGRWRWQGLTQGLVDRVEAGRAPMGSTHFDAAELDGLPPVVQRYFRTVLPEGAPVIVGATVEHRGTFRPPTTGSRSHPANAWSRGDRVSFGTVA